MAVGVRRKRIGKRKSKKLFRRTARKVHPKNNLNPLRGGRRV